jgi:Cys-rich repeat protein
MPRVTERQRPSALAGIVSAIVLAASCGSPNEISLLGGGVNRAGSGGATSGGATGTGARGDGADRGSHTFNDAGHACVTDDDCGRALGHCDPGSGVCVECLADSHCSTYLCDATLHACITCDRTTFCHAPLFCDDDDRRCVQCRSAADCKVGEACVAEAHACAARCASPADCSGSDRPICAAAAGVCVECASNTDCAGGPSFLCDLRTGSCVECLMDSDCQEGHCTTRERRCVECLTNADCSDGKTCLQSSFSCAYP